MRGVVLPAVQYPSDPLKTKGSSAPVPIPNELALTLSAHVATHGAETVLTNAAGGRLPPRNLAYAVEHARAKVEGLSPAFRFHHLRHYFASLLIANGADVKVVQARLRHASATTTLNTYSHLWPDSEQGTRDTVAAVLTEHADSLRTSAAAGE